MSNNGNAQIVGAGDFYLETNCGAKLILKNVNHVLDGRLNLIYAGKLDDEGYCKKHRSLNLLEKKVVFSIGCLSLGFSPSISLLLPIN